MTLQERITIATHEVEGLLLQHGVGATKAARAAPELVQCALGVLVPPPDAPPADAEVLADPTSPHLFFSTEHIVWLRTLTLAQAALSEDAPSAVYVCSLSGEQAGRMVSQLYAFDLDAMAATVLEIQDFASRAGIRADFDRLVAQRATHDHRPEDHQ